MKYPNFFALVLATLLVNLCAVLPVFAGQCTLAWDASSDPAVSGYKLYWGTASGTYGTPLDAGKAVTFTVPNLTAGIKYFAVTAYDRLGNESGYSNEVFYNVPVASHTITASAQPGGTISQRGAITVLDKADLTIVATPDPGYHLNIATVDGLGFGNQNSYTFSAVTTDHTISFSFAIDTFSVVATTGAGGTIDCSNEGNPVNYGSSVVCAITPDANKRIAGLWADGLRKVITTTYSFSSVNTNHTISIAFKDANVPSTIAVCSDGICFLDQNGNGKWDGSPTDKEISFGHPGDTYISGDWDGTGVPRIGTYRDGVWKLDMNGNSAWDGPPTDAYYPDFGKGLTGAVPVTGDWDGDGVTEIGLFSSATGSWYLDRSGNGSWDGKPADAYYPDFGKGLAGAVPVTGDWDGNGVTEIGLYSSAAGSWYLDRSGNGSWDGKPADIYYPDFGKGLAGAEPVAGDWDGDGVTEIGLFSSTAGSWYLDRSGNGSWDGKPADTYYPSFGEGLIGVIPVVNR